MSNIFEIKNITFEYPADEGEMPNRIFDGLSLSIERGSFTAILGHNGSGKSTLARMLNGLKTPASGQILVDGMDTADETYTFDIRSRVGLVFQNPDNQIVSTIVEEDVAFGPENLGIEPSEIRKRVDEALKAVDMYDYRTHASYKLSGGQKQRIAIAGILAMQPECIVLDEPTAMLDPRGRSEVMAAVERLNRERGMTVVLITHYMNEAALADRIIVMENGGILLDGKPYEVFSRADVLKSVGLDVPQPTELILELKKEGIDLPDGILTDDQCIEALSEALGLSRSK